MGAGCSAIKNQLQVIAAEKMDPYAKDRSEHVKRFITKDDKRDEDKDTWKYTCTDAEWQNFFAQCELIELTPGMVLCEQGKKAEYLYILHQGSYTEAQVWRCWNEPEKVYLFTVNGVPKEGSGITTKEWAQHNYTSGVDEYAIVNVWDANPVYIHTIINTTGPDDDADKKKPLKVHRWPMSNWAAAPQGIKDGITFHLKDLHEAWKGRWRENEFHKVYPKDEFIRSFGVGQTQKTSQGLFEQFQQNQKAWGYEHWGTPKFAFGYDPDSGEEDRDPETDQITGKHGKFGIVCHNPAATEPLVANNGIAVWLKWTATYDKSNKTFSTPKTEGKPEDEPEIQKHTTVIRIDKDTL